MMVAKKKTEIEEMYEHAEILFMDLLEILRPKYTYHIGKLYEYLERKKKQEAEQ